MPLVGYRIVLDKKVSTPHCKAIETRNYQNIISCVYLDRSCKHRFE